MAKKSTRKQVAAVAVAEEPVVEEKVKADVDEKKNVEGVVLDEASVQQCLSDIKAQGIVAVKALKKYFEDKGSKSLFPEMDYALTATVVYKKPAMVTDHLRAKILLPRPDKNFQDSTVCLIMPDLEQTQKARSDPDVDKQAREWAEKIEKDHDLKNKRVKILTKRQLERECKQYKEKRALATQHDVFLVDSRVAKSVNTFLGKEFDKVHKRPQLFDYGKPLATTIANALSTVSFPLNRYMTRASVGVGHLGQDTSDIAENINIVVDRIVEVCPGGLPNVRSIYIQPSGSEPSLPIFADQGSANEVELVQARKEDRHDLTAAVDDCSTLPEGLKLQVRKNGKLRVLREKDGHGIHYPTVKDEWDERDITKPTIDPSKLAKKKAIKDKRNRKRASEAMLKGVEKKKTRSA